MSKKKLNVTSIANELEGASLYFSTPPSPRPEPQEAPSSSPDPVNEPLPKPDPFPTKTSQPGQVDQAKRQKKEKKLDSSSASMLAYRHNDTINQKPNLTNDSIETIRKTVKQVGKEPLFIRATAEEKQRISSLVYAFNDMYRGEGRKTSENEIGRIAINWLLEDYQANGEASTLAQVLAALNA